MCSVNNVFAFCVDIAVVRAAAGGRAVRAEVTTGLSPQPL